MSTQTAPHATAAAESALPASRRLRPATLLLLLLGLFVCSIAISNQSYWIDEAGTAYKALQPTLPTWWQSMRAEGNSNLQLPFYLAFIWAWEKLAGLNEFALRFGNAPWFLLGLGILARAFSRTPHLRWGISLALLSSPFAWYYLNEARPYMVQMGTSLALFAAFYRLGLGDLTPAQERRWVIGLCVASVVLAASGMLAMLWLGAYFGAVILCTRKERLLGWIRTYLGWWIGTLALLFGIGLFYLWTLSIGARATAVGGTDLRNLLFIAYELLGFSGLGPGRAEIRTDGLRVFKPWLPWLALYGGLLLLVLVQAWRSLAATFSRRTQVCWAIAFALMAGFLLAVGVAVRFRVLGRHCTPLFPVLLLLVGTGLGTLLKHGTLKARLAVVGFVGLSLVSGLALRFSERHAKDDYRSAAALARQFLAQGQSVWWNADEQGAFVYHLPLTSNPTATNAAFYLVNPPKDFHAGLPTPQWVLTSKPDVYDGSGALAGYLTQTGFKPVSNLTAFVLWQLPK